MGCHEIVVIEHQRLRGDEGRYAIPLSELTEQPPYALERRLSAPQRIAETAPWVQSTKCQIVPSSQAGNLAKTRINCRCQVCAFFHSFGDEYKAVLPFFNEGCEHGDKADYILDKEQRSKRLSRFANIGVDAVSAGSEQLGRGVVLGRAFICAEFASIKAACLDLLEDITKAGEPHGTGVTRLWANMERAVDD
jgi:hypothetical protein